MHWPRSTPRIPNSGCGVFSRASERICAYECDPGTGTAGGKAAREYTKGRDWYDFLWYVARKTPINFEFLGNACRQQGPWKGEAFVCDAAWYLRVLEEKITATDWHDARSDVERFVRPAELPSLTLWSRQFFLDRVEKLRGYV